MANSKPAEYPLAVAWFVEKVRKRTLDSPNNNDLSRNYSLGELEIISFMEDTISDFNETEPAIASYNLLDFPSQEALMLGCISKGLSALAIMHHRNNMPYNAGGITASRHAVAGDLERLASTYWQKYRGLTEEKKMAINAMSIMSTAHGLGSDYGLMSWYNNRI